LYIEAFPELKGALLVSKSIIIRSYQESDCPFLSAIFFNTIHTINTKDYTPEQINAWAPVGHLEPDGWVARWQKLAPIVVVIDNQIVGFAEFEENGHIDCFYVHHEFQGCGAGSALLKEIEQRARANEIMRIFAEVSITAKSFFEAKGFSVVKQQVVSCRGAELINFVMEKIYS
jgi:putative acetyltransferase